METTGAIREVQINLRARKDDRDLIDRGAAAARKTRTEFMLDSARQAAMDALLDQRLFVLDASGWAEFNRLLDAPPERNAALAALLHRETPWN